MQALQRLVLAVAWVTVAALVALGGAGIIASMNHLAGSASRPELTYAGDRAAEAALDAATTQLEALSGEVDALGTLARQALTEVNAGDVDPLSQTLADGVTRIGAVQAKTDGLASALARVPGLGPNAELRVSAPVVARYRALTRTQDLTTGLAAAWTAFSGRALSAATLTSLLERHDRRSAAAASEGSAAHYRKALDLLDESDALLDRARQLRDNLAASSDVSTLSAWIDRNGAYDTALRDLYSALIDANGRVTDRVRRAFAAEQAARRQLPPDTRGLVVIMSDIARGGLNQAVILIEQARGSLAAALEMQQQLVNGARPPG